MATHKTIPYPVLKVLKVQTKPWELGWEVKNQESQGGLVLSIQAVITNTTDWGACEQQKSHFSLLEAETAKMETPADCLLRTCFLEGTFLLHVLTWWKRYGSLWGLLFIYLFIEESLTALLSLYKLFHLQKSGPPDNQSSRHLHLVCLSLEPSAQSLPLAVLGAGHQSSRFLARMT